jgi:hypothetical protein
MKGKGVAHSHPQWLGVAVASPKAGGGHRATLRRSRGGLRATLRPLGVAQPSIFSFFLFFLFFLSIFIYFLINLYFFIKMDTCRHFIGDTWRWRYIWKNLLIFLMKFDSRDRFVIIANHNDLLWTFWIIGSEK